jgi:hypothetical protein
LPVRCQANSATFHKIFRRPCRPNGYSFMDNNLTTLHLMDAARSLLAESLRLLLKAHGWDPPDLSKEMGKSRQWSYRLIHPNKNERGTTLTTLDQICTVFNRQNKLVLVTSDLFNPEKIRQMLGWVDSAGGVSPAGTPPSYTPDNPSTTSQGVLHGGVTADSLQRLEARFVHLESIMFDCYATLARYYAPTRTGNRRDDHSTAGAVPHAPGSSHAPARPHKTPRKSG